MTQAKTAAREAAHQFLHGYYDPGIVPVATLDKLESIILAQRAAVWREAAQLARTEGDEWYGDSDMSIGARAAVREIINGLAAKAKEESDG